MTCSDDDFTNIGGSARHIMLVARLEHDGLNGKPSRRVDELLAGVVDVQAQIMLTLDLSARPPVYSYTTRRNVCDRFLSMAYFFNTPGPQLLLPNPMTAQSMLRMV